MRTPTRALLLCSILSSAACAEILTAPSIEELAEAPERVVVDGTILELETYLWRDFMPVSPPDGKPLIGSFRVRTADGSPIPQGLAVDAAYVIRDDEIWPTAVDRESPSAQADVMEVIGRDGPKWGPGVAVDVVVRIRYAGTTMLLKASDQPIHRTD